MDKLNRFTASMDTKTNIAYALIRIFLGIALSVRGWMILSNPDSITELIENKEFYMWISLIGVLHLLGGMLLCLGFLLVWELLYKYQYYSALVFCL